MTRVLVADDSPAIRKIARRILDRLGFSTAEADDGRKALTYCAATLPDIVLLDWNMPVVDGFTFAREFRKIAGSQDSTLILCTTENDLAHIARAQHAGIDTHIMKPFDQDIMATKLAEFGLLPKRGPAPERLSPVAPALYRTG